MKGPRFVIAAGDGRSNWMPDPAKGYANTIISPLDYPMLSYSMGTQCMEPGEVLPEHYHERHEELFYILRGRAKAFVDGVEYPISPGMTLFFGRNVAHGLVNDGEEQLAWVWIFNPPGLENVLAGVGMERVPDQPRPASVPRPADPGPLVRAVTKLGRPGLPAAEGAS